MKKNLSPDEIMEIAEGIYTGKIFTSDQCPRDMIPAIFMGLLLLSKEGADELLKDGATMLWEHMSERCTLAVNGYPTFFSCHIVYGDDREKIHRAYERLSGSIEMIKHEIGQDIGDNT